MRAAGDEAVAVLVRGIGDVGSAVAHALFRHGYGVVVHDTASPLTPRRGMAFADAMYDGHAVLAGVRAQRGDSVAALEALLARRQALAVTALDFETLLARLPPAVLIDARMRKHVEPEDQRRLAPLVLGLGPNFEAGGNVDLAVETEWGERLGAVVQSGATAPLRGEPRAIAGRGRERMVYAHRNGRFTTSWRIGQRLEAGAVVGRLAQAPVRAPLAGRVRGLVRDGVEVPAGTRLLEIDPRTEGAEVEGLGRRPQRIAQAVLQLIAARLAGR